MLATREKGGLHCIEFLKIDTTAEDKLMMQVFTNFSFQPACLYCLFLFDEGVDALLQQPINDSQPDQRVGQMPKTTSGYI